MKKRSFNYFKEIDLFKYTNNLIMIFVNLPLQYIYFYFPKDKPTQNAYPI